MLKRERVRIGGTHVAHVLYKNENNKYRKKRVNEESNNRNDFSFSIFAVLGKKVDRDKSVENTTPKQGNKENDMNI